MKTTCRLLWTLILPTMVLATGGCRGVGIGDPCVPENAPPGGFQQGEAYLETSAVQCRTRVCMVYQFGASAVLDPSESREACERRTMLGNPECSSRPTEEEIAERVYCTCRCQAPAGVDTPTCECADGFTCVEDLLTLGGDGIRGGYCVRSETAPAD